MKIIERYFGGPTTYHPECNDSELMFSRLNNKTIRKQFLDWYWKAYQANPRKFLFDFEDHLQRHHSEIRWDYKSSLTRRELEDFIIKIVELESKVRTKIDRSEKSPWRSSAYGIVPNFVNEQGEKPVSEKVMSIIVAHEKGHLTRGLDGPIYDMLMKGFDQSKIQPSLHKKHTEYTHYDTVIDYLFGGTGGTIEILERMSQMKNYFGFKGAEKFTKKHLDILKTKINGVYKYTVDTGMNNNMDTFLDLITTETEEDFIFAMNNAGI